MKRKTVLWLLILCISLSVSLPCSAEGPENLLRLFGVIRSAWWAALEEQNAPPKIINRIADPSACPDFAFPAGAELLDIWFPVIQNMDAAVFRYQGQWWMLDCGDEFAPTEVVPLLKALNPPGIDRVINTHPHHDHLDGFYAVNEAAPVRELCVCFPPDANARMQKVIAYCRERGILVSSYQDEDLLLMGDGGVSFLCWQKPLDEEDMNNRSAQFMVFYGDCSILFMADIELRGERQMYEVLGPAPLKADILRYPHHGKEGMIEEFFRAVDPGLVIVTNAANIASAKPGNRFLSYHKVPVAYTAQGCIHLVTDGRNWLAEIVSKGLSAD